MAASLGCGDCMTNAAARQARPPARQAWKGIENYLRDRELLGSRGERRERLAAKHAAQQVGCALAATSAARAHPELDRELVERARAGTRAFLDLALSHGVADADVQARSSLE